YWAERPGGGFRPPEQPPSSRGSRGHYGCVRPNPRRGESCRSVDPRSRRSRTIPGRGLHIYGRGQRRRNPRPRRGRASRSVQAKLQNLNARDFPRFRSGGPGKTRRGTTNLESARLTPVLNKYDLKNFSGDAVNQDLRQLARAIAALP